MNPLFHETKFTDFGPSEFLSAPSPRIGRIEGHRPSALRAQLRLLAPNLPGVYGMLDAAEELIYVGKAKDLRVRLHSYFRKKGRPRKAGKLIGLARSIIWEALPSEFTSLLRELELIRRWRPRMNVQGQPLRRRLAFICLGRSPAPYLYLSRRLTAQVHAAFGPITFGPTAQEAVRRLNDWFRLRDCPEPQEMIFPDQGELFPGVRPPGCLRMDIGTCLAPCTGTCARRDYQKQAKLARAFLDGTDLSLVAEIQAQMESAAAAQQFERAAELRDRWEVLSWLAHRLERVRKAQTEMSFIYPVAGFDGTTIWHLIHGARVIGVIDKPRDAATRQAARERIRSIYHGQTGLLDSYEHADSMMTVMMWFRKRPGERKRCLTVAQALGE